MASYDFTNEPCDAQFLIPILNILGDNLIGIELGVGQGQSTLSMVANCGNIKKLYAIDNFLPYQDKLKNPYNNQAVRKVSKADIEFDKLRFYHNLKYSGLAGRINVIENDKNECADKFEDNFFDFIFADAQMNYEDTIKDIETWYPKLKEGGIFSMHDADNEMVRIAVERFRRDNDITNHISWYGNTVLWMKINGSDK